MWLALIRVERNAAPGGRAATGTPMTGAKGPRVRSPRSRNSSRQRWGLGLLGLETVPSRFRAIARLAGTALMPLREARLLRREMVTLSGVMLVRSDQHPTLSIEL